MRTSTVHGRRAALLLAVGIALVTVVASLGLSVGSAAAAPAAAPTTATGASSPATAGPIPTSSGPVGISNNSSANATGSGVFYNTTSLPSPAYTAETCVSGNCYEVENDPATTVTSSGLLVAAYTVLSDRSPCVALRSSSVSNIGITTSTNGGRSWSGLKYVGNPVCAQTGYPDAWEPAITSLANGTLVLAYVQYGLPAGALPLSTWPMTESRLVVTESYDSGAAWTTPTVLNISNPSTAPPGLQFTPADPSIAATGQTIYLTWYSLTTWNSIGSVALEVSTDGGGAWSPTIPVASGFQAGYSMDPQVTIGPSDEVVIAYTANVTQNYDWCTPTFSACYFFYPPLWTGNVWVATSPTNGTVFDYSEVAQNIPEGTPGWDPAENPVDYYPFETPAPQIAYSNVSGELYIAFSAGVPANGTTDCFYGQDECLVEDLYFYSSPDGGITWNQGTIGSTVLNPNIIDPSTFQQNSTDSVPTVAIAASGYEVDIEASYYQGTLCDGATCGIQTEVVFSSTDNGTTFNQPATIAAAYTPYDDAWTGEYTSVAELNGTPLFFWTLDSCPGWAVTPCSAYPYSNLASSQVEVSTFYNSTAAATLTFTATGLESGANWTIDVLGNIRTGAWNQSLSISGVPTGIPIFFSVPGVNESTVRFYVLSGAVSPTSPLTLHGSQTVDVAFTRYVPVTISYRLPDIQGPVCYVLYYLSGCPSFSPGCEEITSFMESCYDYYFNPVPPVGEQWIRAGQSVSIGLAPWNLTCGYNPGYGYYYCYIYQFYLDPLGWAGSGPGSVSSSGFNISFTPEGPVTEAASFLVTGYCFYYFFQYVGSSPNIYNYGCGNFTGPLTIEENGLPAGSTWGVSLGGAAGSGSVEAQAGQEIYNASADIGTASITPWDVPSSTPGEVYVGSLSVPSPMLLPLTTAEVVTYHLENVSQTEFPVTVDTLGLPPGIAGNATFTNEATGITYNASAGSGGTTLELPGGDYLVNVSTVATTEGAAYLPREIYGSLAVVGATNQSGTVPATIDLEGAATITLAYGAEYWVATSAGPGGSVSPASEWVTAGSSVVLTATPETGYSFLGWYGRGPGATTGPEDDLARVAIQPSGPVSELATFGPTPPATYTVTVLPTGIPADQPFSIQIGSSTYSGAGTFRISNLSAGTYTVTIPDQASEATSLARYVLTFLSASGGLSGDQLTIESDLSLLPQFETQYLVSVTVSGQGSLSIPTGNLWTTSNSTLDIAATPASGWTFSGWWISQNDAPSTLVSTSPDLSVLIATSANLVAQFVPAVVAPAATYVLSVNETGLPSGTPWAISLSPAPGVSGTATSLAEAGLTAGAYTLGVGTVYGNLGYRYVPSLPTQAIQVAQNETLTVTFTLQVLVTVSVATTAGSTSASHWENASTTLTFTAPAAPSGWQFVGWQGSGPGNYTGTSASATVTPTGPVTETASYAPITTTSSSASTPVVDYVAIGLVAAALLGVGIAEGWLTGRKRPPVASSKPASSTASGSAASGGAIAGGGPKALPPASGGAAPPWSESGDTGRTN